MKKYSWISYLSLGLPILLFLLLFAVADIEPLVLAQTILIAQLIGAPLSIILSVAALFKRMKKGCCRIWIDNFSQLNGSTCLFAFTRFWYGGGVRRSISRGNKMNRKP